MSIHVSTSAEAQNRLKKQKTQATITSIIISLVVIGLIAVILALLTIFIPAKEVEAIISYQAATVDEEVNNEPKIRVQQRQMPTPPSAASAVANVITTTAPTSVSIPDTNTMTNVESPDFGSMDDFGMGFGFEDTMSSTTSFFGSKVSGTRICYVIDYSLSMKGKRDELMREELSHSISSLKGGAQFGLIMFAGPAWEWSDQIELMPGTQHATLGKTTQRDGKEVVWETKHSTSDREFRKFKPSWVNPTEANINETLKAVKDMPLLLGTEWSKPLEKALDMKPQPEVIIFMTDGASGSQSLQIAEEIGNTAKRKSITINTIALMQPQAKDALKAMAEITGGSARMVRNEQEIEDLITGEVSQR